MPRTIVVKGTGRASLPPDRIEVSLSLRVLNRDYDAAMRESARLLTEMRASLTGIGFREEDLKTASFRVDTEYESVCDEKGNYRREFSGYAVVHDLKLEFDFDSDLLSQTLSAVSRCAADPELSVRFTVKDKNAVSEALLKDAAGNARSRAEILAEASGVMLGQLLSIQYSWGEIDVYSPTNYRPAMKAMAVANDAAMGFTPEDITVEDSVAFEWEIAD